MLVRIKNASEVVTESEDIAVKINLDEMRESFNYSKYDFRFLNDFKIVKSKKSECFEGVTIYWIKERGKGKKKTALIDSRLPLEIIN